MRNKKKDDNQLDSLKQEAHYDDHLIPLADLCARLDTHAVHGLTSEKAHQVLQVVGPNVMAEVKRDPWWALLFRHFFNFFSILLWIAAGLCLVVFFRDYVYLNKEEFDNLYLSGFIIIIICVSGFFGFYTAKKSHDIMSSFSKMLQPTAHVIRDKMPMTVSVKNIVPGDLVVLQMGDCVPADVRVIESVEMKVDNSALTGESEASAIEVNTVHPNPVMSPNIAFFSTHVMEGHGKGIVIRTGRATYIGRIAELTASIARDETLLERDIRVFVYGIAAMAFITNVLVFTTVMYFGYGFMEAVILVIGLTVALIPEGLSITLTVSLSLTARRMAEKKCLVKNINAISTLGSVSVICSDKTGTLTLNKMTVMHVWFSKRLHDVQHKVPHSDPDFLLLMRIAALCNRAYFAPGQEDVPVHNRKVTGDASETAILKFFEHYLGSVSAFRANYPKVYEEPFNSTTKYQMSIHELPEPDEKGAYLLVAKGAPEKVIGFCSRMRLKGEDVDLTDNVKEELDYACEDLAAMGQRVLAMAEQILSASLYQPGFIFTKNSVQMTDCVFVGLVAMEDPPRETVPDAVSTCRAAGIKVMMVTGDHPTTAASIARQIGIISPDSETTADLARRKSVHLSQLDPGETNALVITGMEMAQLDKATLSALISQYDEVVFARTSPTQKLLIVESAQGLGHIVAVTGDGVNDAPALRQADVGVAMGIAGSDVAKESADIILLNDDFSSIVNGIREGRLIIDNIKKSLAYVLTSNVPELVPFLLNAFIGIPVPLTVIFILLIDAFTDLFPAISLAYEKPESDIMLTNPRKVTERIVNCKLIAIAQLGVGVIQACSVMVAYFIVYMAHGFWPSSLLFLRERWTEEKAFIVDSYGRVSRTRSAFQKILF